MLYSLFLIMKFINCTWELDNLGKRVCEVRVDPGDVFNVSEIESRTANFEYIVIKVPMCKIDFNIGLGKIGYSIVETQINISQKYEMFNFEDRLSKFMLKHSDEVIIKTEKELNDILRRVTPDMFSSDRIYLDSHFPNGTSMRRYLNWIKSEFVNKSAIITKTLFDGREVGFGMYRDNNGDRQGLLGGIYEDEQDDGLGFLTGSISFLAGKKNNRPFNMLYTSISSNNLSMLQIYNYLHFRIDSMTYVFIKHNN